MENNCENLPYAIIENIDVQTINAVQNAIDKCREYGNKLLRYRKDKFGKSNLEYLKLRDYYPYGVLGNKISNNHDELMILLNIFEIINNSVFKIKNVTVSHRFFYVMRRYSSDTNFEEDIKYLDNLLQKIPLDV